MVFVCADGTHVAAGVIHVIETERAETICDVGALRNVALRSNFDSWAMHTRPAQVTVIIHVA